MVRSLGVGVVLGAITVLIVFSTACLASDVSLRVSVTQQTLSLMSGTHVVKTYPVSTSKYGTGNLQMSYQTPLGRHVIARKIGAGAQNLTVFRNRKVVGYLKEVNLTREPVKQDLVTTRILWLRGLEPGVNAGGRVDSLHRMIYIHGTPDEGLIGTPASHGCIRMKNRDVIELFDLVSAGTPVIIEP